MNRKHWWVFGVIQLVGTMATAEALLLQFPTLLIVSFVLLLPGSLASLPLLGSSHSGYFWSPRILWAIAVATNGILFTVGSFLLAKRRKTT